MVMDETGFTLEDFTTEMGEIEVRKTKQFDRMWKVTFGGSIGERMCVHDGRVYFGASNRNVYCLDGRTGKKIWMYTADGIIVISSPVISDGMLYIGSYDKNLYALEEMTGRLVWKFRTQGEIAAVPLVVEGIVYVGSRDHNFYAVDAKTGKMIWKFQTRNEVVSAPSYSDGRIYIGSFDRNMYCLDAKTGRLFWKFETQGEIFCANGPLIVGGVVHFPSFDSILRAVRADTGELLWKLKMGQYGLDEAPVYHEGRKRMYMGTRDGYYACMSLEGKFIWKFWMSAVSDSTIACFWNDRLYVGSGDYNFYCLNHDGKVLWKYKTNGTVWWYPAVLGDSVVFCSWDCNVYCVGAEKGELRWKFRCSGSPSYLPPANDIFELEFSIPEKDMESETKKVYSLDIEREDELNTSSYKSEITYQMGTAYMKKGKYQIDEKTEGF